MHTSISRARCVNVSCRHRLPPPPSGAQIQGVVRGPGHPGLILGHPSGNPPFECILYQYGVKINENAYVVIPLRKNLGRTLASTICGNLATSLPFPPSSRHCCAALSTLSAAQVWRLTLTRLVCISRPL